MAQKKLIKLNLGSGYDLIKGFINVDYYIDTKEEGVEFVKADIRNMPFDKNYADYILCNNVLEHLPQGEVPDVLYEIKRILKPGGQAILIVPDFTDIAKKWLEHIDPRKFDWTTYKFFSEIIFGNQMHDGEYHKTAFYPGYFNYILHMVGLHKFEMIMINAGTPSSALKEFEGVEYDDRSVIRNAMIIIKITK
jgi:predicted SAM-dependent methyltransferase